MNEELVAQPTCFQDCPNCGAKFIMTTRCNGCGFDLQGYYLGYVKCNKEERKETKNRDVVDVLGVAQYCYSKITAMAIDENIYDVMVYGDSLGTIHYVQELALCLQKQHIIDELLELERGSEK